MRKRSLVPGYRTPSSRLWLCAETPKPTAEHQGFFFFVVFVVFVDLAGAAFFEVAVFFVVAAFLVGAAAGAV